MLYYLTKTEQTFCESRGFFHLHTNPIEDDLLFRDDNDYRIVNNMLAVAASRSNCLLLAYVLMSNHMHFIMEGTKDECLEFFEVLKAMMGNYFIRHGRGHTFRRMKVSVVQIDNVKQLRNEIAYVIRNPFVVREDVNPLSYPWSSGYLYYNPMLPVTTGISAAELKGRSKREFLHSRIDVDYPSSIVVKDGMAQPASFVAYARAMAFFDNARQFLIWVFKNVEGQIEASRRLGELPCLNDHEMLSLSVKLSKSLFRSTSARDLPDEKKKQLALKLKNDYCASNSQLARCLGLSPQQVNTMFPLANAAGH